MTFYPEFSNQKNLQKVPDSTLKSEVCSELFFHSRFLCSSKRLHSSPFSKMESSGFDDKTIPNNCHTIHGIVYNMIRIIIKKEAKKILINELKKPHFSDVKFPPAEKDKILGQIMKEFFE